MRISMTNSIMRPAWVASWAALCFLSAVEAQTSDTFFQVYNLVENRFGRNQAKTMVRLAFHDAMGGVDGRLQRSDSEHNGLLNTLDAIDTLYTQNAAAVSPLGRSDFFAWAYVSAFYMAVPGNPPWVPLTFGRADVGEGASEDVPPGSEFGSPDHDDVLSYFSSNFGFSASDTAVILGAHTLGGAETGNSGFTDDWTNSPDTFNAQYYRTLVDPPQNSRWEQVAVGSKFQWRWGCNDGGGCRDLMLNVDMALFFDIDFDSDGKAILPAGSSCSANDILDSCFPERSGGTQGVVSGFSNGNQDDDFTSEFADVYARLIDRVKTSSSLTSIAEPANFPGDLGNNNNNGGDDGGDGNGGGGGGCFAASTTVEVQNKGLVPMKDLQVGDLVRTGNDNDKFEPVYAFGHWHDSLSTDFLAIHTVTTDLELTGNHLVFAVDKVSGLAQSIRADRLQVGDILQASMDTSLAPVTVTKISTVTKDGLYMPLTPSGRIIVNGGIVASCYVSLKEELPPLVAEHASLLFSDETLLHWWLSPYRMLCLGVSSAFGSTTTNNKNLAAGAGSSSSKGAGSSLPLEDWKEQGKHPWLIMGKRVMEFAEDKSAVVQFCVMGLPVLLLFGMLHLFEVLVGPALAPTLVALVAVWVFRSNRQYNGRRLISQQMQRESQTQAKSL